MMGMLLDIIDMLLMIILVQLPTMIMTIQPMMTNYQIISQLSWKLIPPFQLVRFLSVLSCLFYTYLYKMNFSRLLDLILIFVIV